MVCSLIRDLLCFTWVEGVPNGRISTLTLPDPFIISLKPFSLEFECILIQCKVTPFVHTEKIKG